MAADSRHASFAALHRAAKPLLLPNAWDAASARLWQELGAAAVATSSAAVAWSRGYADGGDLPRHELLSSLEGMIRVLDVPLTVDLEAGYSDRPEDVGQLARAVVSAGAVGINLEDGLLPPGLLVAKIRAIREALRDTPLFINARTDVYLRGLATGAAAASTASERLNLYREAGADGAFVPALTSLPEVEAIAAAVAMPLSLMTVPALPPVDALYKAGVRRISVGPTLFKKAYGTGQSAARAFLNGDISDLFQPTLDYAAMNRLFAHD
ncbi:MAG: isocitrate lyase/phosphoenolpyruvate mutase family protein [Acidobacteriota bacterium]